MYLLAAERTIQALDDVLDDDAFFAVGGDIHRPDSRVLSEVRRLLGDELLAVMARINYAPPPEASRALKDAQQLVDELCWRPQPVLRADVVPACREGLLQLRRKLYTAVQLTDPDEPAAPRPVDPGRVLASARTVLLFVAVAGRERSTDEPAARLTRQAAIELAVAQMYCFETDPLAGPRDARDVTPRTQGRPGVP